MLHSSRHHRGFKEWAVQIIHSARPKQLPDAHSARKSAPDPSPGRHCAASIKSFGLRICATTKAGQDKQLLANTLTWMCFFAKIPFWYRRIYIKQFISLLDWCHNIRYSGCLKVDSPIQICNTFSLKLRPRSCVMAFVRITHPLRFCSVQLQFHLRPVLQFLAAFCCCIAHLP